MGQGKKLGEEVFSRLVQPLTDLGGSSGLYPPEAWGNASVSCISESLAVIGGISHLLIELTLLVKSVL